MICPMLSALKPTDDNGHPVDRECIYENCRFFDTQKRDCNLMLASRAMLKMSEEGPRATASGPSPTALTDMERRFTEVGRGLLQSSMEMQEIVRQAGQETAGRVAEVRDALAQRLEGLEARLSSGQPDIEARLAAGLKEIEGRLAARQREMEERIVSLQQESEGRTAQGLQAYLGEMRASLEGTIGRVQTRLDEQGRGVGATAAASSQSLDQLTALTDLQQKVAERLLEEISLLSASSRKLEQALASLDKKMDKSTEDGMQISQQLLLVKGQSEKTHAALRGLHEGNRAVIQAVETQLQRDQADLGRKRREEAEECNNRGVGLYYKGALEAALAAFRRAIELLPDYAEAHNNLGLVLSKMGQEKDATEAFQQALRLDPAMAEVYNNLGFMYHTSGKFERAVQMFGQAIQNSADSAVAYTNLGNSFYKMKQPEKAVEAWRRALELDPMNENARRSLRMFQQDPGNN
jgi:Tfp pilus assembly protein PilF